MERLEILLEMLDEALDTRRKRHIVGGILLSVSLFFGGLAVTIITINKEEKDKLITDKEDDNYYE